MIFNVIIVLLILGIAYFHYEQGLIAATVSLFCAAVAAFMAFSYHETVVTALTGGKLAAYGDGMMLCGLFALIYVVLRFVTDNLIVGNARYPVALDKGGAAVMGLVAALFPAAIVAIAAQELPFGPTVAGYAPLPVEDTALRVPNQLAPVFKVERGDDVFAYDQLRVETLNGDDADAQRQGLWIPVDRWFLGLVATLSDTGSLKGPTDFREVNPDFQIAAFADRLGMQRSATQVALNVNGKDQVAVKGLYRLSFGEGGQYPAEGVPQVDGDVRGDVRQIDKFLKPAAGKAVVVVRINFQSNDMADRGNFVRFSPASCRLVAGGKQFFPVGTFESSVVAVSNLPDDFLLAGQGADLIYQIDTDVIDGDNLAAGSFLEFKRFGRVGLDDKPLQARITTDPSTFVLRKVPLEGSISAAVPGGAPEDANNPRGAFDALRDKAKEAKPPEDQPAADGGAAGNAGGPMGVIRGQAAERNKQIEGGGQKN